MSLHNWLGRHSADLRTSPRERGSFVNCCTACELPMIELPGLAWQLRPAVG